MWWIGLLLGSTVATAPNPLERPPPAAPGGLVHQPKATLQFALEAKAQGHTATAIQSLEAWLNSREGPWDHRRITARFLLGWLYLQEGQTNLASAQFTKVRVDGGPLAPLALWYEALCDHQRGRHAVAARECEDYRTQWPTGEHADQCLLLIGHARTQAGQHRMASAAWTEWLETNASHPRHEQVQLDLAIAQARLGSAQAIQKLQGFTLRHSYPSIGQQAQIALEELKDSGRKLPELDPLYQKGRQVMALVQAGQFEAGWELFTTIIEQHGDEDRLQEWLDENSINIAWRTRNYDAYVQLAKDQYRKNPTGHAAWRIFRALQRSGDHYAAGEWATEALKTHSRHYKWRRSQEQVALTWQLAGEYEQALAIWESLANRRGATGRKARWFAAFCLYRSGALQLALEAFERVQLDDGSRKTAALYYQAKIHRLLGNPMESIRLQSVVLLEDPMSWYGQLVASQHRRGMGEELENGVLRAGLNAEEPLTGPPAAPTAAPIQAPVPVVLARPSSARERSINWGALEGGIETQPEEPVPGELSPLKRPQSILDSYTFNPLLDNEEDLEAMDSFAQEYKSIWPDLEKAYLLSEVGLTELAAPYVERSAQEWSDASRGRGRRLSQIRALQLKAADWRPVIHAARDHHSSTRFSGVLERTSQAIPNGEDHLARLTHPAAHMALIDQHSANYGVDPLLTLGLMRQESRYRRTARSRVGATGLMQVMPQTGAKIAYDLEEAFIPDNLTEPQTNIRYGIWYLGQLLTRFEGGWPLAVAAYNAGPMNVSSWYTRWEGQIDMDDFVEQIPFTETRDYVKKVTLHYANYVNLYAPNDRIEVPDAPGHNLPGVISY
ncbi:MAG: transglycosylase SLT domain-containing protein [Myxococcota bacterium]|nr:transglycosylase SLT domain-containing protein [Myxococcota bacterium]